jgi:endonuclease/exonuclease/phosphatase (EEP) superfamily protein YafD
MDIDTAGYLRRLGNGLLVISWIVSGVVAAASVLPAADILAPFTPAALVVSFASGVLAFTLGARSKVMLAICAATSLGLALRVVPELSPASLADADTSSDAPSIKIMTANLQGTATPPQAVIELIARERPDVLTFQEAYGDWKIYFDRLAPEYHVVAGCQYPNQCDTVIVSRFPLREALTYDRSGFAAVRLHLPLEKGGGTLDVMSVHFSRPLPIENQLAQMEEALALISKLRSPIIVAGDFNSTPWSPALQSFEARSNLTRHTRMILTWPSPSAQVPARGMSFPIAIFAIDHILSDASLERHWIRRGPDIGSDHFPVFANFLMKRHSKSPAADAR